MKTSAVPRRGWMLGTAAAAVGVLAAAGHPAAAQVAGKRYRTMVHVTDGDADKWTRVVGYIRGLESSPEKADLVIAVMVQGLATDMLKLDSPVAKAWTDAVGRGVELVACEYSMKTRNLTRDQLIAGISRFVPFGGTEIVKRQAEGWAYLRP